MLFRGDFLDGLAAGRFRHTFRRWTRANVRAGTIMRTAIGLVRVDEVVVVEMAAVSASEARLAGFTSADALRADLPDGEGQVYRIALSYAGPDPRITLRNEDALSRAEWEALEARLRRIDAASRRGPWTLRALTLLAGHPGVRAARLAPMLDRETLAFKRDIRVLKELGLTESLEVGYRLSPRGRAALDRLTQAEGNAATAGPGRRGPRASSSSPRRP